EELLASSRQRSDSLSCCLQSKGILTVCAAGLRRRSSAETSHERTPPAELLSALGKRRLVFRRESHRSSAARRLEESPSGPRDAVYQRRTNPRRRCSPVKGRQLIVSGRAAACA